MEEREDIVIVADRHGLLKVYVAVVGDSHVVVPTGRASTVIVYVWASAVFVVWANVILAVV